MRMISSTVMLNGCFTCSDRLLESDPAESLHLCFFSLKTFPTFLCVLCYYSFSQFRGGSAVIWFGYIWEHNMKSQTKSALSSEYEMIIANILYLILPEVLALGFKNSPFPLRPLGWCSSDGRFVKRQQMEDGDCLEPGDLAAPVETAMVGWQRLGLTKSKKICLTSDTHQQQHLTTLTFFNSLSSIHKSDYFWAELFVLSCDQFIWEHQKSKSLLNYCVHPNRLDQI